jgi:hypothetical protein
LRPQGSRSNAAWAWGPIQRVGKVRPLGHYPPLGVEPEAAHRHVAFGDPAGDAVGCADAGNEPAHPILEDKAMFSVILSCVCR